MTSSSEVRAESDRLELVVSGQKLGTWILKGLKDRKDGGYDISVTFAAQLSHLCSRSIACKTRGINVMTRGEMVRSHDLAPCLAR